MDTSLKLGGRMTRRSFAVGSLASAVALSSARPLMGQEASPVATPVGVATEVLLTGLLDPRFIAIDGTDVYFTESGTGGDEPVFATPGAGTPEPADPVSATGLTGKLSRLSADGTVTEIVSDFRSYTFGTAGEIVGPAGVALDGAGYAYVAVGAPGPSISQIALTGDEGAVFRVDLASGEKTIIADILTYEIENNPDPVQVDSNLYGLTYVDGTIYVADAGGNAIYAIDAETGEFAPFAVTGGFPAEFLPETGNPGRGGARELDSVPSGLAIGPDGRIYASFTTGGPFPAGFAPIIAYTADGTPETYATGLTMSGGLDFASDGRLYVAIVSLDLINGAPGQIVRVEDDGSLTVIVDNVLFPAGIQFDDDDNLYVLEHVSVIPGGGQLVKYSGVTSVPAASPATPAASPVAEATPVAASTYHIDFVDTAFEPASIAIPADTDVEINFENKGFLAHDFALADPAIFSGVLGNGGTSSLTVNLAPGTYQYFCTQIGHRELGMVGTLTVA